MFESAADLSSALSIESVSSAIAIFSFSSSRTSAKRKKVSPAVAMVRKSSALNPVEESLSFSISICTRFLESNKTLLFENTYLNPLSSATIENMWLSVDRSYARSTFIILSYPQYPRFIADFNSLFVAVPSVIRFFNLVVMASLNAS